MAINIGFGDGFGVWWRAAACGSVQWCAAVCSGVRQCAAWSWTVTATALYPCGCRRWRVAGAEGKGGGRRVVDSNSIRKMEMMAPVMATVAAMVMARLKTVGNLFIFLC